MPWRTKPTGYTSSSSAVSSSGWDSRRLCTPNGTAQILALLVYKNVPPWPGSSSRGRELASPWVRLLVESCGSSCYFSSFWGLTVCKLPARYKIEFRNPVFNGYTSPAWIMAIIWAAFWVIIYIYFEDIPKPPLACSLAIEPSNLTTSPVEPNADPFENAAVASKTSSTLSINAQTTDVERSAEPSFASELEESFCMTPSQWGVTATMCWFAMTCFFTLGAWEASIPVYTGQALNYSPFAAGNLIALGGICTFPFLIANILFARRFQDHLTLAPGTVLGAAGEFIMLAVLKAYSASYGSLFAA